MHNVITVVRPSGFLCPCQPAGLPHTVHAATPTQSNPASASNHVHRHTPHRAVRHCVTALSGAGPDTAAGPPSLGRCGITTNAGGRWRTDDQGREATQPHTFQPPTFACRTNACHHGPSPPLQTNIPADTRSFSTSPPPPPSHPHVTTLLGRHPHDTSACIHACNSTAPSPEPPTPLTPCAHRPQPRRTPLPPQQVRAAISACLTLHRTPPHAARDPHRLGPACDYLHSSLSTSHTQLNSGFHGLLSTHRIITAGAA